MKPKAPQFLIDYYLKSLRGLPPKCCHSCDHYDNNGKCTEFDAVPTDEFLVTQGCCIDWVEVVVPF